MIVYLTRHGLTEGNKAKQYIGAGTDLPLCEEGIALLRRQTPRDAGRVYTSNMLRALQTADILYPQAEKIPLAGLREMHFGSFEGKNWQQLQHDPDYNAWLDSQCESTCPGGENRGQFIDRTAAAFMWAAATERRGELHIVAHGGSIMALLHRFAGREYFSSKTCPGCCWVCELHNQSTSPWLEILQKPEECI